MEKSDLTSGMLVKITAGKGAYGPNGKWSSIIWVFAVTKTGEGKVQGIQYKTIATRGGDHSPAGYFEFRKVRSINVVKSNFDDWWETFNAKILV